MEIKQIIETKDGGGCMTEPLALYTTSFIDTTLAADFPMRA
jgi:hypothetical protein